MLETLHGFLTLLLGDDHWDVEIDQDRKGVSCTYRLHALCTQTGEPPPDRCPCGGDHPVVRAWCSAALLTATPLVGEYAAVLIGRLTLVRERAIAVEMTETSLVLANMSYDPDDSQWEAFVDAGLVDFDPGLGIVELTSPTQIMGAALVTSSGFMNPKLDAMARRHEWIS